MSDNEKLHEAVRHLWLALSEVMSSVRDTGADEGALHEANKHMNKAHELLS